MPALESTASPNAESGAQRPLLDHLVKLIDTAAALLPAQGPITAFVFLNTLQALEDLPFDQGVAKGARLFGCQPYMTEDKYRESLAKGRIRLSDLKATLKEDLADHADKSVAGLATCFQLRQAMLEFPLRRGPAEELRWFIAETDALKWMRAEASPNVREALLDETRNWVRASLSRGAEPSTNGAKRSDHFWDELLAQFDRTTFDSWSEATWEAVTLESLWQVCCEGVLNVSPPPPQPLPFIRHRDLVLEATGQDSDALVHPLLIRFCAAFTDQGLADWPLPQREIGFYRCFCQLYRQPAGPPDRWMRDLARELERLDNAGVSPQESLLESLSLLGVKEEEWSEFLTATLLALRGWAGLIRQNEVRGDRVALPVPAGTLVEFVAIRLILERVALRHVASSVWNGDVPLSGLREAATKRIFRHDDSLAERRAFLVFQLAQALGWSPPTLHNMSHAQWGELLGEIEGFSGLERRRIFHLAFERGFRIRALDAFAAHVQHPQTNIPAPRFQTVYCIDTREESFRRHLEEIAPDAETFGTAGFFGVPIYYRGAADAHFQALCPIVIRPKHWIVEDVVYTFEETHRRRAATRRALGAASHQVHVGSRSVAGGALLTAGLGVLASIPLVARVLFPRLTAQIRKTASRLVATPPVTRLRLERSSATPGPKDDEIGFSIQEMADSGERVLREIGLTSRFARLVIFFGHGSFCLNNPHKSAYDCGACSGSAGAPNARALAAMLNEPRVRDLLAERGLVIPRHTVFLGGLHNTCEDALTFFDLDLLPQSHLRDFDEARKTLERACERNAHERCRRFQSAPLDLSFPAAHRHVQGRAEDLAQTRPEFGNASNAMCFVGRRANIRGLYLDRRCFLVSYDPEQDDADHNILARILGPAVFVCSGINLQYHFSYIDSSGWGSGTKLPHNVTSLLGVMDGHASDLRTGLPWQGVEIHEPVRLMFIIETDDAAMFSIMDRNPVIGRILRNGWAQLALLNPQTQRLRVYRHGHFEDYEPEQGALPRANSSTDWYRGHREHLGFAEIDPQLSLAR